MLRHADPSPGGHNGRGGGDVPRVLPVASSPHNVANVCYIQAYTGFQQRLHKELDYILSHHCGNVTMETKQPLFKTTKTRRFIQDSIQPPGDAMRCPPPSITESALQAENHQVKDEGNGQAKHGIVVCRVIQSRRATHL